MDTRDVMEKRRNATKKGNRHWRRGTLNAQNATRNTRPKEWRTGMDTTRVPHFAALVPVNAAEEFPVDARKLHAALGNSADFPTWWAKRINAYGFQRNADYQDFQRPLENPNGGRPARDYMVTLDMAKHLSMVEKTEMGRKARDYFIDCERQLLVQSQHVVDPNNLPSHLDTARALVVALEEKQRLEDRNAVLEPKAEALEALCEADGQYTMQAAAGILEMGRNTLFRLLRERHILQRNNIPYREHLDAGRFSLKAITIQVHGEDQVRHQVFVRAKGLEWLHRTLNGDGRQQELLN